MIAGGNAEHGRAESVLDCRRPRPRGVHDKDQSSRAGSSGHESERMTGLDPLKIGHTLRPVGHTLSAGRAGSRRIGEM
jgi:hypothetical protein